MMLNAQQLSNKFQFSTIAVCQPGIITITDHNDHNKPNPVLAMPYYQCCANDRLLVILLPLKYQAAHLAVTLSWPFLGGIFHGVIFE